MDDYENYKIKIDKRWSLEDLYIYPRAYEQVYFAFEALLPTDDKWVDSRIERAFRAFPWQGGYSAVNFYNQLKHATPKSSRPVVTEMRYASPGFIELYLSLPLAVHIASAVTAVAGSILACNKVYNQIYTDLQRRKLLRMEVEQKKIELTRDEIDLVVDSSEILANMMGIDSADAIHNRTGNPLISLKILLSVYRRIRTLAEYQNKSKANLRTLNELLHDGDL
jgi:hypothetical protein